MLKIINYLQLKLDRSILAEFLELWRFYLRNDTDNEIN